MPTPKEFTDKIKAKLSAAPAAPVAEEAAPVAPESNFGSQLGEALGGLLPRAFALGVGGSEGYQKQVAQEELTKKEKAAAAQALVEREKEAIKAANEKRKLDIDQYEADTKRLGIKQASKKEMFGKELTSQQTDSLAGHGAALDQLKDIKQVIETNQDSFGPIAGRLGAMNPYNKTSQNINAMVSLAAQNIGKSLEGGKMTDQDIERYKKMLPSMSDTPDVAVAKLEQVERLVNQRKNSELSTLGKAGYNVTAMTMGDVPQTGLLQARSAGGRQAVAAEMSPVIMVKGQQYSLDAATGKYKKVK